MNVRHLASGVAAGALLCASATFGANASPTITTFSVPTSAVSPVPITALRATDSDGTVAGYLITTTSTKPAATAPGWTSTPPTSYATGNIGSLTLYAWAKDNLNAVSNSVAKALTVVGSHLHAMADVTGLTTTLAAKADTSALNGYQKKYSRVITVSPSPGEADFTSVVQAVNSINNAGGDNQYLVKLLPGHHILDPGTYIQMRDYVDIEGSGRDRTWISGGQGLSILGVAVVNGSDGYGPPTAAELRDLTISSGGDTSASTAVVNIARVANAVILSDGAGILVSSPSGTMYIEDVYVEANTTAIYTTNAPGAEGNGTVIVHDVVIGRGGYGIHSNQGQRFIARNVFIHVTNWPAIGIEASGPSGMLIDGAVIESATTGFVVGPHEGATNVFNRVDVSAPQGLRVSGSGGHLEVSNSKVVSTAPGYAGITFEPTTVVPEATAVFQDVYVNTADAGPDPALRIQSNAAVQLFQGRYVGGIAISNAGAVLKAVGAQIVGTLPTQGTVKLFNCCDANLDLLSVSP